jgi:hypothetical protein
MNAGEDVDFGRAATEGGKAAAIDIICKVTFSKVGKYAGKLGSKLLKRTPKKKVPNPWGMRGSPAHQAEEAALEKALKDQGYRHIAGGSLPQQAVEGTGVRPDLIFKSPTGGLVYGQIGKQTKGGLPVWREMGAIEKLWDSGAEDVIFSPYNLRYIRP